MSRDQAAAKVEDNRVVTLRFTLADEAGETQEEATADDPLVYLHGHGNIVPGLEEALTGREVGERFEVQLPPDEAFGVKMEDPERVIPRDVLPEEVELRTGFQLIIEDDGESIPAWVLREVGHHLVVSLCHPLAGQTISFEGEILSVREATPEELEHGHAHGVARAS